MCDSADRTDNTTDNNLVFLMSNIIPQDPNENQVVWGNFEDYCRSLITTQELLITCGPRNFGTTTISGGHVYIPSNNWKIAVCVPLGAGTAYDRLTNATAASIRVIAVDIPNAPQTNPWQSFVTSAKQIQQLTGFTFFNALPNNLAWVLRSKVDGQAAAAPSFASFAPSSGSQSNSVTITGATLDTITNVSFNGTAAPYSISATNQIIALVPVGASSGQITVWGLGGNATSVSSFTVAPPVVPDFTITPANVFASSGSQGGPFQPIHPDLHAEQHQRDPAELGGRQEHSVALTFRFTAARSPAAGARTSPCLSMARPTHSPPGPIPPRSHSATPRPADGCRVALTWPCSLPAN